MGLLDSGIGEGLNQASGTVLQTGMQLTKFKQDQLFQQQKLSMEQAHADRVNKMLDNQLAQQAEAKAKYDKPVDITVHPLFLSLPDEVKPTALKYFSENGWTDQNGKGKYGDVMQGVESMEKTAPVFKELFAPVVQKKKEATLQAWNELQEVQQSGDPKKIAIAQKKFNDLSASYMASSSQFDKHLETLMKPENETKVPTTDFQTFRAGFARNEGESDQQYNKRLSDAWEDKQDKRAMNKTAFNINLQNPADDKFKNWDRPEQVTAIQSKMITGKDPRFAFGDRSSYNSFNHEYNKYINDKGFSARDVSLIQADYRAGDMSLKNMTKQEAPMSAFVLNINKQIDKVQQLYNNNDRVGLRLLDLPVRELRVRAKGSGDEAVKSSYLLEISNEIGKLSSGASGSVQQLSDSAKEDWKKVHDVNLSMKEIMKVVNATREQANMRMQSWREAKQEVRQSLGSVGNEKSNLEPFDVKIKLKDGRDASTLSDAELLKLLNGK